MSLFADDILAFFSKPSSSIPDLLKDLDEYEKILGFLNNNTQTMIMMLSGNRLPVLRGKVKFQ